MKQIIAEACWYSIGTFGYRAHWHKTFHLLTYCLLESSTMTFP